MRGANKVRKDFWGRTEALVGEDGRMDRVQATSKIRKRKAENQDNERLSKRLSLLNLGLYSTIHLSV